MAADVELVEPERWVHEADGGSVDRSSSRLVHARAPAVAGPSRVSDNLLTYNLPVNVMQLH
jgi:hypothetical protein